MNEAALWDAKTGEEKSEFRCPTEEWIQDLAFSPDSKTLVACGGAGTISGKSFETSGELIFFRLK